MLLGKLLEGGRALKILGELLEGGKAGKLVGLLFGAASLRRNCIRTGVRKFGAGLGGEAA